MAITWGRRCRLPPHPPVTILMLARIFSQNANTTFILASMGTKVCRVTREREIVHLQNKTTDLEGDFLLHVNLAVRLPLRRLEQWSREEKNQEVLVSYRLLKLNH